MSDKRKAIELMIKAERCRENVIRMIRAGGHGHVGGAFSAIDLVAALYFHAMNIDGADAKNPDRDRFLLSAGHKCLAQYGVLAEKDFFEKEILDTQIDPQKGFYQFEIPIDLGFCSAFVYKALVMTETLAMGRPGIS